MRGLRSGNTAVLVFQVQTAQNITRQCQLCMRCTVAHHIVCYMCTSTSHPMLTSTSHRHVCIPQGVLEQLSVPDRAKAVLLLLKKEVELCKLQADIREQVRVDSSLIVCVCR